MAIKEELVKIKKELQKDNKEKSIKMISEMIGFIDDLDGKVPRETIDQFNSRLIMIRADIKLDTDKATNRLNKLILDLNDSKLSSDIESDCE